jgi:hypothetical protein
MRSDSRDTRRRRSLSLMRGVARLCCRGFVRVLLLPILCAFIGSCAFGRLGIGKAAPYRLVALISGRGQEKSSARPRGATTASPRLSTRVANGSACISGWLAAPKSSPAFSMLIEFRGRTGPTTGRPVTLSFAGGGSSGPGNATGSTSLPNSRRRSPSVPKLLCANLGEIHAVISAKPTRLSLEIRSVLHKTSLIVAE